MYNKIHGAFISKEWEMFNSVFEFNNHLHRCNINYNT